ncbi:farnesyl diphosphate synthase [Streptococcus pneumoniae]|nr:farnesyl diphosphate synthase [Streptococcus pneumoniae]
MKKQEKLALVESALEDFYGDQQFASSSARFSSNFFCFDIFNL